MDKRADPALRHRIPVIDRMMEVLGELEAREAGASISDLVARLGLPRTTVYRILNSLQRHDMVQRSEAGSYHLGHRLLALASHVAAGSSPLSDWKAALSLRSAVSSRTRPMNQLVI